METAPKIFRIVIFLSALTFTQRVNAENDYSDFGAWGSFGIGPVFDLERDSPSTYRPAALNVDLSANYKYLSASLRWMRTSQERDDCGFLNARRCSAASQTEGEISSSTIRSDFSILLGFIYPMEYIVLNARTGFTYALYIEEISTFSESMESEVMAFPIDVGLTLKLNDYLGIGINIFFSVSAKESIGGATFNFSAGALP